MKPTEILRLALTDPSQFMSRLKRCDIARKVEDIYLHRRAKRFAGMEVNQLELCILGMRRTGNHAIIHWLEELGRLNFGNSLMLNNIVPGDNGYRHRVWFPESLSLDKVPAYQDCRMKRIPQGGVGMLVRTYEDYSLETFLTDKEKPLSYGGSKKLVPIVIYRDPGNLFASRIKSGYTETKELEDQIALYVNHMSAFGKDNDILYINFNAFVSDEQYREDLARTLGIKTYGHDPFSKISQYGGGSSFGSQITASDLQNRFLKMCDNEEFRATMQDARIKKLFETHYPDLYAQLQAAL